VTKVTWPSRKETAITTGMVFIMVMLASIFLTMVDWVFAEGIQIILGIGG